MIASLFSLAYRPWIGLISVLIGLPLGVAIAFIGDRRERRRKMRAARPQLEQMLDAMIAMVEHPTLPLEKIAFINSSDRRKDGALGYRLHLHGETGRYALETTTDRKDRMCVQASRHEKEKKAEYVYYPEIVGFSKPEPWLTERLQKLRALVGDISGHEAMQKRLKELGIDLDDLEDEETPCGS